MKKETIDIRKIAHQIKANQSVYHLLPKDKFEEHILRMLERLIMQKKLFLKEISNTTDQEQSEFLAEENVDHKSLNASILEKYKESISNEEAEACLALLIQIEQKLFDQYDSFLFKNKPDEIARMILGNQANEIKRDIRILKDLYEYA